MPNKTSRLIILDRDGVINEDLWGYVTKNEEFNLIDGSLEAIASLTDAGFHIAVATNQACINRKIINKKQLDKIHDHMTALIETAGGRIDYIACCPHLPEENCSCRKPETGLLQKIEEDYGGSLENSFFIGDKESDIVCASRYGCIPLLVKTGYGIHVLSSKLCPPQEQCFDNLSAAVSYVLKA